MYIVLLLMSSCFFRQQNKHTILRGNSKSFSSGWMFKSHLAGMSTSFVFALNQRCCMNQEDFAPLGHVIIASPLKKKKRFGLQDWAWTQFIVVKGWVTQYIHSSFFSCITNNLTFYILDFSISIILYRTNCFRSLLFSSCLDNWN